MSEIVIVLDTETTGLTEDPNAEVIEVCTRLGLEDDAAVKLWRIRPLRPVPAEATKTHGITDADLVDCPTFGEVADEIAATISLADVIVGYNPDFDVQMLRREFVRSGCTTCAWPPVTICGKRLWDIYRPRPKRDLQAAFQQFVDPAGFQGAHGAAADTLATARLLRAQLDALELRGKPWHQLDPERASWWGPSEHAIWVEDDLVLNFGKKHRGVKWIDVPVGFLSWIIKSDFPSHVRALAQQVARAQKDPITKKAGRGALAYRVHTWAREKMR